MPTAKLNVATFSESFHFTSPEEYLPLPGSIRYFHKFDPIPSFYFSMGEWAHGTEKGILLSDYATGECQPAGCGHELATELSSWLCEGSKITTGAEMKGPDYYSYTNMVNPLPCAEVLLSAAAGLYPSTGTFVPWQPTESFKGCTESYIGSIIAYFGLYMASDLVALRGDEFHRDPLDVITFYVAWGLMWIHSAYANYCLSGEAYGPESQLDTINYSAQKLKAELLHDALEAQYDDIESRKAIIEEMAVVAEESTWV